MDQPSPLTRLLQWWKGLDRRVRIIVPLALAAFLIVVVVGGGWP